MGIVLESILSAKLGFTVVGKGEWIEALEKVVHPRGADGKWVRAGAGVVSEKIVKKLAPKLNLTKDGLIGDFLSSKLPEVKREGGRILEETLAHLPKRFNKKSVENILNSKIQVEDFGIDRNLRTHLQENGYSLKDIEKMKNYFEHGTAYKDLLKKFSHLKIKEPCPITVNSESICAYISNTDFFGYRSALSKNKEQLYFDGRIKIGFDALYIHIGRDIVGKLPKGAIDKKNIFQKEGKDMLLHEFSHHIYNNSLAFRKKAKDLYREEVRSIIEKHFWAKTIKFRKYEVDIKYKILWGKLREVGGDVSFGIRVKPVQYSFLRKIEKELFSPEKKRKLIKERSKQFYLDRKEFLELNKLAKKGDLQAKEKFNTDSINSIINDGRFKIVGESSMDSQQLHDYYRRFYFSSRNKNKSLFSIKNERQMYGLLNSDEFMATRHQIKRRKK